MTDVMPAVFAERYGYVQYDGVEQLIQAGHVRAPACEICGQVTLGFARYATVFDHCHEHGWIRGEICGGCNRTMDYVDTGTRNIRNLRVPIGRYLSWRLNCPGCARDRITVLERELASLRAVTDRSRTHTCKACGEPFTGVRADSRWCSNACRQRAYRERTHQEGSRP